MRSRPSPSFSRSRFTWVSTVRVWLIAAQLPDVSQQDFPRLQPSRPRHESREQLELEGGELDLVSVDVGAMRDLVDAHRTDAVAQLLGPGRRAPAQDGTDAQHQLADAEGLGDEIVGAQLERPHPRWQR